MKCYVSFFLVLSVPLLASQGIAYEVDTHEKLSETAAKSSILSSDTKVLENLGLSPSIEDNNNLFPNAEGKPRNILNLIKDGAKFEDTLSFNRPMHHFYNPLTGAPLTVLGISGSPSPDWALEDKGQINGVLGKQDFSYQDARQYFYDALTQADKTKREQNFGKTFQTIGHIIHHVQDMAQPQHVRNDQHLELGTGQTIGLCVISPAFCAGYFAIKNPSAYEAYTNRPDVRAKLPIDFSLAGYDINDPKFASTFNTPRNLWHTADGKGMADYANRGFVSAGTIFDIAFPSPVLDLSKKLDFDIKHLVPGTSLKGNVRFYGNTVTDNYTGASVDNPMAVTRSIFDAELEKYATFGKKAVYTLNRFNFDVAHSLLIPRAVGYSAGLINYFFRGKIDFIEDTNNPGKYVIKNLGPEDMKGTFTLYYDAADGKRYPVPGDQPTKTWASRTIAKNGQLGNLSFSVPTNPAPEVPGKYMLVFNGDMGEEKAIPGSTVGAVAAKYVEPERSGFLIQPNFATADGITGPRHIYWDGAQWKLSKEKGLLAGNVDWKGWYVNGKPTKVLSWMGPASRYGLDDSAGSFTPYIYQNGGMFAIAPNPVLAAALTKDANGVEWLVAIGSAGGNVVFIRPNTKKLSAALYDATKTPDGWRQIGNLAQDAVVGKSWSFNGSGNEAQVVSARDGDKARRKVNIQFAAGGSAQAVFTSIPYVSANLYSDIHNKPDPVVVDNSSACAGGHFSTYYKNTRIDEYSHWEGYTWLLAVDYSDNSEILAEQHIKYGHNDQFIKIDEISREIFNNPLECDSPHAPIQNYLPEVFDGSEVRKSFASRTENVQMNGVKVPISPQESNSIESKVWHAVLELRCFLGRCETIKTIANNFSATVSVISEGNAYYLELPDIRGGSSIVYRQSRKDVDSALPIYSELLEVNSGGGKNAYSLATQVGIPNQCLAGGCQGFGKLPYPPSGYQAGFGQDLSGHVIYTVQALNQIVAPVGKKAYFNFLSGGSIEALIPYGSGDASYSYIGLIK